MAHIATLVTSGYRGRLAPSPTGYLHVGHARTFWTAYERARAVGGALIMRMEDLDPQRSKAVYAEAALEDLHWLGIRWHEGSDKDGPDQGGNFGPYLQSRRQAFYLGAWRKLLQSGFLYPCHCSRKDLEAAVGAPHEGVGLLDGESVYPGTCRPADSPHRPKKTSEKEKKFAETISDFPEKYNWRFRIPDGETISFVDQKLGAVSFVAGRDFGDFLVWRRDGVPSYQLACVVDDAAMKITEVVRGADLLKSTARQILLNRALGFTDPQWYHCPLVVDHNGQRLAKRHDALSLRTLRQRGVTPMNIFAAELPVEK